MPDAAPDPAELRAHLERVLQHAEFASAPRLTAFLRFVVNETLEGRANRVKAYTIATTVFGRGESFDPQTNPVVRVEAMRLRQALAHYYATDGAGDPLEIRIGRGSYVPEFICKDRPEPDAALPVSAPVPLPSASATSRRGAVSLLVGATAVAILAWPAYQLLKRTSPSPPATATEPRQTALLPTVSVTITAPVSDASLTALSGQLTTRLETALSRFDYPLVLQRPAAQSAQYQMNVALRANAAANATVDVKMIHAPTSTILWAKEFERQLATQEPEAGASFAGEIAARIGQTYGIVFADMRKRAGPLTAQTRGFDCIVHSAVAVTQAAVPAREDAEQCLARTLAAEPDFSAALSSLAFLKLARYVDSNAADPNAVEVALGLANRAVSLTPNKARAHGARFWARFLAGRFDDAFDSAQTAIEINPFGFDTISRIGAAHMLRGRLDEGHALIRKADAGNRWHPGWHEFFYFLNAYMKGDDARAARHALRQNALDSPLGHVARIIALGKLADSARQTTARRDFEQQFPGFANNVAAGLARVQMAPDMREKLLADYARPATATVEAPQTR